MKILTSGTHVRSQFGDAIVIEQMGDRIVIETEDGQVKNTPRHAVEKLPPEVEIKILAREIQDTWSRTERYWRAAPCYRDEPLYVPETVVYDATHHYHEEDEGELV